MLACLLAAQAAAMAPAVSHYEAAAAHRSAGRHHEAVEAFQAALRAHPDHVDALVGLGLSLSALGRNAEAEHALRRAVVLAPEYWDAHVGLARLALVRGDREGAHDRLAPVRAGAPDHPDARALAERLEEVGADPRRKGRIDVWTGRSSLSGDLPSWSQAGAVLALPVTTRWTATAAVEATRRFDRSDVYLEGGIGRTYGGGAWRLAVGGTPDADHRPELALKGEGVFRVGPRPGLAVILDSGWSRFPDVEVASFSPGLRLELNDRLALQGRWVAALPSEGGLLSGYAVRADVTAAPGTRLLVSWADAPESSEGRPVTVQTFSLGGARDLSDQLSVSLTASHEDRDSFNRDEVVLGGAVRF